MSKGVKRGLAASLDAELERFSFDETHSSSVSLTAADPKVRACAGAPDDRRAAFAAWSDSDQTGIALVGCLRLKGGDEVCGITKRPCSEFGPSEARPMISNRDTFRFGNLQPVDAEILGWHAPMNGEDGLTEVSACEPAGFVSIMLDREERPDVDRIDWLEGTGLGHAQDEIGLP